MKKLIWIKKSFKIVQGDLLLNHNKSINIKTFGNKEWYLSKKWILKIIFLRYRKTQYQ